MSKRRETDSDWTVRIPLVRKCWHRLAGLLSATVRRATPIELELRRERDRLRHQLGETESELRIVKWDKERLESEATVLKAHIRLQAEVMERDRKRVEAESAILARHIADAIDPKIK